MAATVLDRRYQQRLAYLRRTTSLRVAQAWRALPSYNRPDVDQFLTRALPAVDAGQRAAVTLTEAFLARATGGTARGLLAGRTAELVLGAGVRNGVDPATVYQRPFVTVWQALSNGRAYQDAVNAGLARAESTAALDVALSTRAAAVEYARGNRRISQWERVPDEMACTFCLVASTQTYSSGDLMPLHNNCGCTVSPLGAGDGNAGDTDLLEQISASSDRPDYWNDRGAADVIREHGELGPVLVDPEDTFTGPDGLDAAAE
jgi:hypothetical protein